MSSQDQQMSIRKPKSMGTAIVLEFLIPGAGLMYARAIGRGVFVLIVSFLGIVFYYGMLQSFCPGYYDASAGTCTTSIFVAGQAQQLYSQLNLVFGLLALAWLGLRIFSAARQVRHYNQQS
jgi:TM2 domain-containing membrane protein YozV